METALASFTLMLPSKIIFGAGTLSRLGEVSGSLGRRALLVVGRGAMSKSGGLDKALRSLGEAGVAITRFEGVESDPSLATCDAAAQRARESNCDIVIAIGGGSVLDVGKTAAAVAPQTGSVFNYFDNPANMERIFLPFVAVPTTAGTGTECTPNAVLTNTVQKAKKSFRNARMVAAVALVDPELTLSLPPNVTAQSGMDALTQAIECYVSTGANQVTDALVLRAIELLSCHLTGAVADGAQMIHREPVALASLMTGMAFGNAGLGAVHGLAHPIGALFHVPHGLVCAVLLPHVCEFNLSAAPEKFQTLAPLLAAPDAQGVPGALRELNRRIGVPPTLSGFGLSEGAFDSILASCRSRSMSMNPRLASDEDLRAILRKSL